MRPLQSTASSLSRSRAPAGLELAEIPFRELPLYSYDYYDADYIPAEKLADPSNCPDCGARFILSVGVIHLGHYCFKGEVHEGLIWTCSDRCFLSFEAAQFMGKC